METSSLSLNKKQNQSKSKKTVKWSEEIVKFEDQNYLQLP